jgi:hypothetical protein
MPAIAALGRLRQENLEFKASLHLTCLKKQQKIDQN